MAGNGKLKGKGKAGGGLTAEGTNKSIVKKGAFPTKYGKTSKFVGDKPL